MTEPQPFKIGVSSETLQWITQRVQDARVIPDVQHPQGKEWADGVPTVTINELVDFWNSDIEVQGSIYKKHPVFRQSGHMVSFCVSTRDGYLR